MAYHLQAFWKARAEDPRACAIRLGGMLEALADTHLSLTRWCKKAKSRAAANKPFCSMPPNIDELTKIVERCKFYTDGSRKPMPELGYSIAAWNGHDDAYGISFHVVAGGYSATLPEPNYVHIQISTAGAENADLVNASVLKSVLLAVVGPWQADWGVIESWRYDGMRKDAWGHPWRPWGGWITYLSPDYAKDVSPPAGVSSERLPDDGLLMLASQEAFAADNPAHVAAVDAIQVALRPVQAAPPPPPPGYPKA